MLQEKSANVRTGLMRINFCLDRCKETQYSIILIYTPRHIYRFAEISLNSAKHLIIKALAETR